MALTSIEFDYESLEGDIITVFGSTDGTKTDFKAIDVLTQKRISKSKLTSLDINNINDLIKEMSEPEITHESDYYSRYD